MKKKAVTLINSFKNLFEKQMVGDFAGSLQRSMILGVAASGDVRRSWRSCRPPANPKGMVKEGFVSSRMLPKES